MLICVLFQDDDGSDIWERALGDFMDEEDQAIQDPPTHDEVVEGDKQDDDDDDNDAQSSESDDDEPLKDVRDSQVSTTAVKGSPAPVLSHEDIKHRNYGSCFVSTVVCNSEVSKI